MSKNLCRMLGLILMLVSVFFLLGGLYLGEIPTLPEAAAPVSTDQPAQRPLIAIKGTAHLGRITKKSSCQYFKAKGSRNKNSSSPIHRNTQLPHIQSVVKNGSGKRNQKANTSQSIYVRFIARKLNPVPMRNKSKSSPPNTRVLRTLKISLPCQAKSWVRPMPKIRPPQVM